MTNLLLAAESVADLESLVVLKEAIGIGKLIFEGFAQIWSNTVFDTSSPPPFGWR
jgi:hypothetical protein